MYSDMNLLQRLAQTTNACRIELETLVNRRDPILLGIAHAFKRACVAEQSISDKLSTCWTGSTSRCA
jgi:hypothetical protein